MVCFKRVCVCVCVSMYSVKASLQTWGILRLHGASSSWASSCNAVQTLRAIWPRLLGSPRGLLRTGSVFFLLGSSAPHIGPSQDPHLSLRVATALTLCQDALCSFPVCAPVCRWPCSLLAALSLEGRRRPGSGHVCPVLVSVGLEYINVYF